MGNKHPLVHKRHLDVVDRVSVERLRYVTKADANCTTYRKQQSFLWVAAFSCNMETHAKLWGSERRNVNCLSVVNAVDVVVSICSV